MFDEWSDPYDIDNFVKNVSLTIRQAPSSDEYMNKKKLAIEASIEPSIGQIINTPVDGARTIVPITSPMMPYEMEQFRVDPNSSYTDGHNVGSQPKINILRSADRETYKNKKRFQIDDEMIYIIILVVAFFFVMILYINTRMQLYSTRLSFNMLMQMYCSGMKQKNTE